jgi:hypothetical protein
MLRLWFLIVSAMPSPMAIGTARRVPHVATRVMTGGAGQGWMRRAVVAMGATTVVVMKGDTDLTYNAQTLFGPGSGEFSAVELDSLPGGCCAWLR